jgi:hypothetical protein
MEIANSKSRDEAVLLYLSTLIDALEIIGAGAHVQKLRTKLHNAYQGPVSDSASWDFERFIVSIGRWFDGFYHAVDILLKLRRIDPDDDLSVIWPFHADNGIPVVDITNAKDETEIVDLLWSSVVEYNAEGPRWCLSWPVYLRCHLFTLDVGSYRRRYWVMPLQILRDSREKFIEKLVDSFCSEKEPAAVSGDYRVVG